MSYQSQTVTLILVNLASILERADEALLPAVYREIAQDLDATPIGLGALTFYRALVQAASSPLAAYLAFHHDRTVIIAIGAFCWAVATLAVGISSSYWLVALGRAANGVGLAIVIPAIQSVVADCSAEEKRGIAFGYLHGSGQLGTILGGAFATLMAQRTFLGLPGWRVAFLVVAIVSFVLSFSLCQFAKDPRPPRKLLSDTEDGQQVSTLIELRDGVRRVLNIRTFQVILSQAVVGQIPWNAMAFFTLWLELAGFSHIIAALLVSLLSVGNIFGSLFGGWLGDRLALRFPNIGRILCAQMSAGSAIPLTAILLFGLPYGGKYPISFGVVFVIMGFMTSWNSPACNWPIFSEIVPDRLRTTVYALDMALGKTVAAVGSPLVGILAVKVYGFRQISHQERQMDGNQESISELDNALSLGKGLFVSIAVPFVLCVTLITGLYWTYPSDRERARIENWVENSSKDLELLEGGLEENFEREVSGNGNDSLPVSPNGIIRRRKQEEIFLSEKVAQEKDEGEETKLLEESRRHSSLNL